MQPELEIGPVTLQTFGLMFALAFIASGVLVARRLREVGKPVDWAYEMAFAALVGGIVGSRLDFLIQNYDTVSGDLLANLFSGSGLVWYGGLIGGAIGVLLWARWRGMLNLTLLDICAPALALGYAVGRIGCQVSGDGDYGIPWEGPWAMSYENGTVPTPPGVLFALYLVFAGAERLLVEFVRRNDDVALGLTQPQLLSVAMIVAGGVWIAVKANRGELRAGVRAAPSA
jgi:phosphatidylglycerol---prolipoprotein diacylglyceryl transferase